MTLCVVRVAVIATGLMASVALAQDDLADRLVDENQDWNVSTSPDWSESASAKATHTFPAVPQSFGPVAPAARQPVGALTGRIVFMNSGHGWTFDPTYWRLQRPTALNAMNEDYGNLDQLNFFATYGFNAGAVVVSRASPLRFTTPAATTSRTVGLRRPECPSK
jgi:hypothetical protein